MPELKPNPGLESFPTLIWCDDCGQDHGGDGLEVVKYAFPNEGYTEAWLCSWCLRARGYGEEGR